jgi:hypothetical protein
VAEAREAVRWARQGKAHDREALGHVRGAASLLSRLARTPAVPDRELLREAAALYQEAGDSLNAARLLEQAGDAVRAAELYGAAGELAQMERLLDREREQGAGKWRLRQDWQEYELEMISGRRRAARAALTRCIDSPQASAERAEYLRLRDSLDARLLASGHVTLELFGAAERPIIYTGVFPVWLGRDGTSGLPLRDTCVSRRHASIALAGTQLILEDGGSRNGTSLAGLRIGGPLPLTGSGEIGLGEDCAIGFRALGPPPRLELVVVRGLDRGTSLFAQPGPFDLGGGVALGFEDGTPVLRRSGGALMLGSAQAVREVELIRGDRVSDGERTWHIE